MPARFLPRRSDPPIRHFAFVAGVLAVGMMAVYAAAMFGELNAPDYGGLSVNIDFSVFWGAGRLALEGEWAAAFDLDALAAARVLPPEDEARTMIWTYPPLFHLVVAPFGALPFTVAWFLFSALTFVAFALATRGPAREVPGGWVLLMAAPATLLCLSLGQNTLLLTALLVGAMEAMRAGRPVLAGLLIGGVTMKPQLGPLLPVALLAGRRWAAFLWSGVFVVLIVGLTAIWPGIGYWRAFFEALATASGYFTEGRYPEHIMITWYRVLALAGVARETAVLIQLGVALAVAAALAWLWWRPAGHDLKAAGFFLAVPLATPYAHYYELVIPTVGVLYMARARLVRGWLRWVAGLIWFAPVIGLILLEDPGFAFAAPLLTLAFGAVLAAARK